MATTSRPCATSSGSVREMVATINHRMGEIERVIETLNHDVRSGAGDVLPLFLGYAERFRTDADTMVGVTELVDRQLAMIVEQVDATGRRRRT